MSRYNLDAADVALARQRFSLAGQEARALLAARLPVPAYDMLLKMSHAFNVMDARGAVGVTERADCFASMRALAREVTSLWAERREELGHPLGVVAAASAPAVPPLAAAAAAATSATPRDFVLEIGSEELPPADVEAGIAQLRERVPALLAKLRLDHGGVTVEGTPRRLAVRVAALAARQRPLSAKVRGPPAKAAFADPAARAGPTKALEGFLKKSGASMADVTVEAVVEASQGKKGAAQPSSTDYVFVAVEDAGGSAAAALAGELPALVASLAFKKTMRWDAHGAAYPRPMRWLLALHGDQEVPFAYGGLVAGRRTRLLRMAGGGGEGAGAAADSGVSVARAEDFGAVLERGRITLGVDARRDAIWRAATAAASEATGGAGAIPPSAREGGDSVLDEVANLVESPTVVVGGFDPAFLELPADVLVTVMRKHQRYFPVYAAAAGGSGDSAGPAAANANANAANANANAPPLLPKFVTVANGPVDVPAVAAGNEAVLRARFEDAAFFYREDLKRPLRDFRPKLKGTVFHRDLGSLFDKSVRVEALAAPLADALSLGAHAAHAAEAAALCKCDLATSVVTEMTELAGVMGRHYAEREGVAREVSEAVLEAALPRFAGDALPVSPAGVVVAVADRLDSLVGLVAAVGAPSATADPYGLRRAAYGMLQALISTGARLPLGAAIDAAAGVQPVDVPAAKRAEVRDFVVRRLEQLLVDGGCGAEAVRAVLAERGDDPALAAATAAQLSPLVAGGEDAGGDAARLRRVMTALARPTRIIRGKAAAEAAEAVDPALFEGGEERALAEALGAARGALEARGGSAGCSVDGFLGAAEAMVPAIDAFFDKVFVMCEDDRVRANRIALLRDVASFSKGVLDLSALPGF
jgi:glycyl-tRNA synthetase